MTRSRARRSSLISIAVLLLVAAGWLILAPKRVGGSTDYVTTHGISMSPRFHTGDLALIRTAAEYRVGDVVAYRSKLLHTVVLHRIIGRDRDRYVFKGDNNNFIDPDHPGRSELIGKLWVHVPGGGTPLGVLRRPLVAGLLTGGVAALFLFGAGAKRRRRTRRQGAFGPVAIAPSIAAAPPIPPSAPAAPLAAAPPVAATPPVAPAPPAAAAPPVPAPPVAPAPPDPAAPPVPAAPPLARSRPVVLPQPTWLTPRVTPIPAVGAGLPVVLPQPQPFKPRIIATTPVAPPLPAAPAPAPPVVEEPVAPPSAPPQATRSFDGRKILIGGAVASLAFLLLGLFAFTRPTTKAVPVKNPYREDVTFGYHADVPPAAGPVYPGASLSTGDPVFLRLVHRVQVTVGYRFTADAPHRLEGTMDVVGRITSSTGWTRDIPLAPATPFSGDRADGVVTLDLAKIRKLTGQVERLTGMPSGNYTLAVVPRLHATGTLSGKPLKSDFSPQLSFQLDALQLRPGNAPKDSGAPNRRGSVTTARRATNTVSLRGHAVAVQTVRWIALGGLLLAALAALVSLLPRFRRPAEASERVQARYRHLIVPIVGLAPNPAHPPIDVTTMDALVALAERSERLILHQRGADADTYLVDDAGTLFRHRIRHAAPAEAALAGAR